MKRGISFVIPNEYGSFLGDVLKPIDISAFNWLVGEGESYVIEDGELTEILFPYEKRIGIEGEHLKTILEKKEYYLIFVELKAYTNRENVSDIKTYDEFINSDCQLVLLVADSSYTTIYCKNKEKLEMLYNNAKNNGFENVQYIADENDFRTRLSVW